MVEGAKDGRVLDEALVLLGAAPQSYAGGALVAVALHVGDNLRCGVA